MPPAAGPPCLVWDRDFQTEGHPETWKRENSERSLLKECTWGHRADSEDDGPAFIRGDRTGKVGSWLLKLELGLRKRGPA